MHDPEATASTRPENPPVRLMDVSVLHGSNRALDGVDLELIPGTSIALVGANGSGKTTLLDVIAGLRAPTTGSVAAPPVAYVRQHHDHRSWMPITVGEVLAMGRFDRGRLFGRRSAADRDAIADAANRLDVADLDRRQFGELSGGQRQRVLVARAVAQQSALLLLDEPITGLDIPSQEIILGVVDQLTAAGGIAVLSTHHLDEARHCDRVVLLAGRVLADGEPDAVLTVENLRAAFGDRVLGDHRDHDHGGELLMLDDHGHGTHG